MLEKLPKTMVEGLLPDIDRIAALETELAGLKLPSLSNEEDSVLLSGFNIDFSSLLDADGSGRVEIGVALSGNVNGFDIRHLWSGDNGTSFYFTGYNYQTAQSDNSGVSRTYGTNGTNAGQLGSSIGASDRPLFTSRFTVETDGPSDLGMTFVKGKTLVVNSAGQTRAFWHQGTRYNQPGERVNTIQLYRVGSASITKFKWFAQKLPTQIAGY